MTKPTRGRKVLTGTALTLVTFTIGLLLAVLVAGSASAKTSPKTTPKKHPKTGSPSLTTPALAPADKFSAINGTVNAAADHEIVGSSAFPNFTTGAVDNYYTMAHSHVDNSPFAEGLSSPFDTGPVGQTAAAGNFQQPQYADSRWPGGPDKASYGNQGGPDAESAASNNRAHADASESSNSMSGPGMHGSTTLAVPKGFNDALQQALGKWNSKWDGRLGMKNPTAPKVTTPKAPVNVPSLPVKPPSVTTPHLPAGVPAPPVKLPSAGAMGATRSPASFSLPKPPSLPSSRPPSGGGTESSLASSTLATLVYKTDGSKAADTSESNTCKSDTVATTGTTGTGTTDTTATTTTPEKPKSGTCTLVLTGESSVGRVSLGGGQIVIDGIHVTASITNDGTTPSYKAAITVASATIGGVPVTIDQNGVHVAGQGGGLPYQQASTALNSALKQAGIQIFLVAPQVTTGSQCGSTGSGGGSGGGTGGGGMSTNPTTTDQSGGGTSSCGPTTASSCQSGSGGSGGGAPGLPAPPSAPSAPAPTPGSSTTTTPSCGPPPDMGTSCDQTGSGTGGGTSTGTTTTSAAPALGPSTTTSSTSTNQTSTTSTTSSCDQSGMTGPSSCTKAGAANGTSTGSSNDMSTTTTSADSNAPMSGGTFQFGPGPGTNNAGEETVTATGVHIVFTQPVSPSGVPAQFVEHILGEVFVDSLATPAAPMPSGGLGFSSSSLSSSPSPSSSCLGAKHSGSSLSGSSSMTASGGGSSAGGSSSLVSGSGAGSPAASALGASSQPTSGTTGSSVPASFAHALKKPLWLLLGYLVWQALVIGTGWSLWRWRKGGVT